MLYNDILINIISKDKKINGYLTLINNTAREIQKNHKLNIVSSSILCRALIANVLLSGNLKNKYDSLSIKWDCTGPAKTIFVEANYEGNVKGYIAEPNLKLLENSLEKGSIKAEPYIGFGKFVISRKTFDNRPPYNSICVIETGEIAEDISIYLKQSLQIKSAINIAISISNSNYIEICGGLLLMAMPGTSENYINDIHDKFLSIGSFTDLLKENIDNNINNILNDILDKLNMIEIQKKNIIFKCNCNKEKILNILKSLDKDDFLNYISDNGKINASCQYCGKEYNFMPDEVQKSYESDNKQN